MGIVGLANIYIAHRHTATHTHIGRPSKLWGKPKGAAKANEKREKCCNKWVQFCLAFGWLWLWV